MESLTDFITSPFVAVMLLGVLLIEAVFLFALWRKKRVGLPPIQIVSFLGSGAAFSLALGGAFGGASPYWIAIWLTCAFIFHLFDLWQRWSA